ncbi:MAG: hypothetical protein MPW14_25500 (plasmid) [Candidatus Manganitrophus sp.]|nr:MAG: hypothetical protein MPW14_25500 [Candidatus Manganitrophus sp.]
MIRLKLLLNVQITSLTLFSSMAMVFFMAPALPREIEERTLYPVLAKPVGRSVYLQGRTARGARLRVGRNRLGLLSGSPLFRDRLSGPDGQGEQRPPDAIPRIG